jgi:endonuclease YncB( thermonuclease family)
MKVKDGDTVVIQPATGGTFMTCRLYGIDAPETAHGKKAAQPLGEEASKELKNMILGKTITVTTTGAKTYNRDVCRLSKGNMDVNLEMVKRGYAWAYREYLKGPYASEYIDAENEAREKKRGLWTQRNPQPPWEFRHKQH